MPAETVFSPSVAYQAIRTEPFQDLPREVWSPELHFAERLVAATVTRACLEVLSELGIRTGAVDGNLELLAEEAGVAAERRESFRWLFRHLRGAGCIAGESDGPIERLQESPWSADALDAARQEIEAALGSTFELIDRAREGFPAYLRGEKTGEAILFNLRTLGLWERFFSNENRIYAPLNRLAAEMMHRVAPDGELRILEVGGGCGSGAEAVLERLGDRVRTYHFTEPQPNFRRRGERRLRERFGDLALTVGAVDINRPLAEQEIEEEMFEIVHAVNTLHVARDLVASLNTLSRALVPGGWLVLAEAVRPHPRATVPMGFVFQMLASFHDIEPEPTFRPEGGFLFHGHWAEALQRAGYGSIRFIPDMEEAIDAYSGYSMAGVAARRPGGGND